MKITEQDKEALLAVLAANPNVSTRPMFHSDLVEKSGFTSPKVTAIRKELVAEGRIREVHRRDYPIAIYLVLADKRQQILDLVMEEETRDTTMLGMYTGLTKEQVHQTCVQLIGEGLLDVIAMLVKPSRRLLQQQMEKEGTAGRLL